MTWPSNTPSRPGDADAGIEVTGDFTPFHQRDDTFSRAIWDDTLRSDRTDAFFASYLFVLESQRAEIAQLQNALRDLSDTQVATE